MCRLVLLTLVLSAARLHAADAFVGRFVGERFSIDIRTDKVGYSGTIRMGEREYPFTASVRDGKLEGRFTHGAAEFDFTASPNGDAMRFTTSGTTFDLRRQGGGNPLVERPADTPADPPAPRDQEKPAADLVLPIRGRTYQHAAGGQIRHPEDWEVKETESAVLLIPPRAGKDPAAVPLEAYMVMTEATQARTPDSPAIIESVEQLIATQSPMLRNMSGKEKLSSGAYPGLAMSWDGENPDRVKVCARVYVTILNKQAVTMVALGLRHLVAEREETMRDIFCGFGWAGNEVETKITSKWQSGKPGEDRYRLITLKPDGTFIIEGNFSGFRPAGARDARDANLTGNWAAADGRLYFNFPDGGFALYRYRMRADAKKRDLVVQGYANKTDIWQEK